MRTIDLLLVTAALSLVACGGDETTTTGTPASTSSSTGAGGSGGEGGGGGAGGSAGGAGPGSEKIILNEMNARSPLITDLEWIEVVNSGDTAFSLNGYAMADTSGTSVPNTASALRFPAEAVIPANGYFIILCDQPMEAKPVAHPDCLPDAPAGTVCYHVTWKLSASTGERVYFLAPNNSVIATADYPDMLAQVAPVDGETWARLPSVTGEFGIGQPTPGAANM
ncbi:MAG TPA: lamin tail domain-containing protein, partial [Polyangiaceae bacterium]|nr:lamin tail domain-containing protein [Polyangiaceae bacterium]